MGPDLHWIALDYVEHMQFAWKTRHDSHFKVLATINCFVQGQWSTTPWAETLQSIYRCRLGYHFGDRLLDYS